MADSLKDKDWTKVVLTDKIMEYVIVKYEKNWKANDEMDDIILEDLRKKAYNEPEVAKVIVISSSDEDLLSDEEIVLMGGVSLSYIDDDDSAEEQPQVASTSRRYRKIFMTGCVLFLRAYNAPVDQYVKKPIKSKVKLINCILALRAPNAPDVGSSNTKRKSNAGFLVSGERVGGGKKDLITVTRSVDSSSTRNDKHANTKRKGMPSDDPTGSIAKKIGEKGAVIGKHTSGDLSQTVNVQINSSGLSKDEMDAMIENDTWLIHNVPLILKKWTLDANIVKEHVCNIPLWGRSSYTKAMVELRVNVELKDTLVVNVAKFMDECLKKLVSDVLKNSKNPRQAVRGVQNGSSSSGKKKQARLTRQEVRNSNPLDALNTVKNNDEMGTNVENSKLAEKGANTYVVSSVHGTSYEAFHSPNTTHLATRINDLKRKMLDEKLVLVDDDGKPLKKVDDLVNADSDSEMDEVFNENGFEILGGVLFDLDVVLSRDSICLSCDRWLPLTKPILGKWGRGVKEKNVNATNLEVVKDGVIPSVTVAYGNTQKDLNDDPVAMEVQSPLVDLYNAVKTGGDHAHHYLLIELLRWEIPLLLAKGLRILLMASSWVSKWLTPWLLIMLGILAWNPDVDILKEDVGNVPVWVKLHSVPIMAFCKDDLSAIATKLGTLLMLDTYTSDMCLQSWDRSSYARVMIELQANMELKDTIVNIGLGVAKKLKKPSQTSRGVLVGLKVSNSNPFDALNLVDNDVEFGTNGGTTNLVNNGANSSGSSFMNVKNSSTSNTPIIDKIRKFEDFLIDGQVILVDEAGNPLKKVECLGDYDSEDEVALVDNDMVRSLASERVGFGTQSLLEQ
ncbi:proteasome subunit alpha type-5 [Tanacetum coccineum]